MKLTKKLKDEKYLHMDQNYGWYIDTNSNFTDGILPDSEIQRVTSDTHFFNLPNIYLLSGCNGNCKYCYQDGHFNIGNKNLKFDEIKEFVNTIKAKQDETTQKCIELFGGEPLLRKDILEIIQFLKEENYSINIATNGTPDILKDEEFIKLCQENVHIRISLDGHTKELHETYRTPNSFDQIVENIRYLRSQNIEVSVKTIIADHNFPYVEDILRFLRDELNVKHWNYNVLYNLDACKRNGIFSKITHSMMLAELCKDKYFEFYPMMRQTPLCQMLISVFTRKSQRCLRTYPFLNYDGKVFINDQLIVPEYSIGSTSHINDNWKEIVKEVEYERPVCETCMIKKYCYLGNYGELYKKDPLLKEEFPTCDILRECIFLLMEQNEKGIRILKKILGGK